MFEYIQRQLVINTFLQNEELWEMAYQQIRAFRPDLMVGYVSSLLEFSRFLSATGKALPSLKAIVAAAEPLSDRARNFIASSLGAPVFNTYGSREFMSIAGECPEHKGLHINAENLFVETAVPSETDPSKVFVTDLHNYGMPFVRYDIGDLGVRTTGTCKCGRGLPLLSSIDGRDSDLIRTANGTVISCLYFVHVMKDIPEVIEFQIDQRALDRVIVSMVTSRPLSERSNRLFHTEMRKVLGMTIAVEIAYVQRIPRGVSGKRKVVIGSR